MPQQSSGDWTCKECGGRTVPGGEAGDEVCPDCDDFVELYDMDE